MMEKEKIHQILSSLWKNDDSVGKTYYNQALQDVQTTIDLKEEPVCVKNKLNALSDGKQHLGWIDDAMALEMDEELTKEVEDYIDVNGFDGLDSVEEVKSIAYHFANWQKEKMIEKAVDATLLDGNLIKQKHTTHPLHVGDKVKIIVIKED